ATNEMTEVTILSNVVQEQSYFLAARIDVNEAGMDSITVWLDPEFGLSDPAGGINFSADALSSTDSLTHFGIVQNGLLHSGGGNSINRVGYIDAISLGTDYASVIPEPSTYALMLGAGSMLALLVVRGRRAALK